jgi:hypothetical protein
MPGANILTGKIEITNIERDGFWILIPENEYFVSFDRYQAFKQAKIEQIFNFRYDEEEIQWPELDVDMEIEALKHPENYPLIFR